MELHRIKYSDLDRIGLVRNQYGGLKWTTMFMYRIELNGDAVHIGISVCSNGNCTDTHTKGQGTASVDDICMECVAAAGVAQTHAQLHEHFHCWRRLVVSIEKKCDRNHTHTRKLAGAARARRIAGGFWLDRAAHTDMRKRSDSDRFSTHIHKRCLWVEHKRTTRHTTVKFQVYKTCAEKLENEIFSCVGN